MKNFGLLTARFFQLAKRRSLFNNSLFSAAAVFVSLGFLFSGPLQAQATTLPDHLSVTEISAVQTFAQADGVFEDGWRWVFGVTVPENETILSMKFGDWVSGINSIPAAQNIRFYSAQSQNAADAEHAVTISDANEYAGPLNLYPVNPEGDPQGDLDLVKPGRQIEIIVEVRVPQGTAGGSYSTGYGIQTIVDNVNPVVTLNGETPLILEAGAIYNELNATAVDNIDGTLPVTISGTVLNNIVGPYTLIYSATDKAGNVGTASRIVNVLDTTAPNITPPVDKEVEATGALTLVDLGTPKVSDNVLALPLVSNDAPAAGFPVGDTTVTWTAKDASNNENTAVQHVIVKDTTGPVITVPSDMTLPVDDPDESAVLNYTVSASDLVVGSVTANCTPESGSTVHFAESPITVACSATDGKTSSSASFKVFLVDSTKPVITVDEYDGTTPTNQDITVTAHTNEGTLNGSGEKTFSHKFEGNGSFPFVATDGAGNVTTLPVTINNIDKTAPTITSYEVTNSHFSPNSDGVKDNAGIDVSFSEPVSASIRVLDNQGNLVNNLYYSDSVTNPKQKIWNGKNDGGILVADGTYTIEVTITDPAGNSVTDKSKELVLDTAKPEISSHLDLTSYVASQIGTEVSYELPAVTDNADSDLKAVCTPVSGSVFAYGETTVTCTAEDSAGNQAVARNFKVTVADNVKPIISVAGFTANGADMPGSLEAGYTLHTENVAANEDLIQFKDGTSASETLKAEYFSLKLVSSSVSPADLKAYYEARGIPADYLAYLEGAADGLNAFAYINGGTLKIVDAARHDIAGADTDMAIPDNYPLGTYTVSGEVADLAGNKTTVTYTLVVAGSATVPTATLSYDPAGWTNGSVTATINPSEELMSGEMTHTFTANGSYTFNFVSQRRTAGSVIATVDKIDKIAPTGSVEINGGAQYTNSRNVNLSISGNDDLSGVAEMNVFNGSSFSESNWESYKTTRDWQLSNTSDGTKTVKVKFKDAAGNITAISPLPTATIILDTTKPVITIIGATEITIYQGLTYTDPGYDIVETNPYTPSINNPVDTSKIGNYTITYDAIDAAGNEADQVTRTVHVVANPYTLTQIGGDGTLAPLEQTATSPAGNVILTDGTNPITDPNYFAAKSYSAISVILSRGEVPAYLGNLTVLPPSELSKVQAWAYSQADGKWFDFLKSGFGGPEGNSASVLPNPMTVQVYVVSPETSHGLNVPLVLKATSGIANGQTIASLESVVRVPDITKPVITILGEGNSGNPAYVIVGNAYHDAGATATDNVDGDLTSKIVAVSTVNTSAIGSYKVTYSVTDAWDNTATAIRDVEVVKPEYNISIQTNTGGSIEVAAQSLTDATYSILPDEGYHIVEVVVDGNSQGPVATYTFVNIHGDHTISATFAANPAYDVIAEDLGVMNQTGVLGYTAGFRLVNGTAADAESIVVKMYKGDVLLASNTSTGLMANYPTAVQLSAPFDVLGSFDYAADGNWSYSGKFSPTEIPDRAEITVTFKYGIVKTAENTNLTGDTSIFSKAHIVFSFPVAVSLSQTGLLAETAGVPTGGNAVAEAMLSGVVPVSVSLANNGIAASENLRIAPIGNTSGHLQFWAKDSSGNWYDINATGWGPIEGFSLPSGYEATTPVYILSDQAGSYNIVANIVSISETPDVLSSASATLNVQ